MNAQMLARHHARRRDNAQKICEAPDEFKVCGTCGSIAYKRAATCPLCRAYRWVKAPDAVVAVACYTARFPFPFTAGTVPRFEEWQERKAPRIGSFHSGRSA